MVRTRIIAMSQYAELQVTTNFSFLRGASHPEELAAQAKHLGIAAIAVTDRNSLAGVVRAHGAAKDAGLKFVTGARLDLSAAPTPATAWRTLPASRGGMTIHSPPLAGETVSRSETRGGPSLLAYPTTRAAYGRLCRLLSVGQRRAEKGQCLLTLDDVYEFCRRHDLRPVPRDAKPISKPCVPS